MLPDLPAHLSFPPLAPLPAQGRSLGAMQAQGPADVLVVAGRGPPASLPAPRPASPDSCQLPSLPRRRHGTLSFPQQQLTYQGMLSADGSMHGEGALYRHGKCWARGVFLTVRSWRRGQPLRICQVREGGGLRHLSFELRRLASPASGTWEPDLSTLQVRGSMASDST